MTINNLSKSEKSKAEKLNALTNIDTFWDDVRELTVRVTSDRIIHEWQYLAERRYDELTTGVEYVRKEIEMDEHGKFSFHYYDTNWNEVYPIVTAHGKKREV